MKIELDLTKKEIEVLQGFFEVEYDIRRIRIRDKCAYDSDKAELEAINKLSGYI